jgi:phytoene synthase
MMACLMGARAPQLVARACDLGVAMQFTNIARDVGEDARSGRLYLPLSWLREAGVDISGWMRTPRFTPEVAAVVTRLLAAADVLYERAGLGIHGLPRGCRRAIRAARFLYAEIGHELRRAGLDSVSRRTVVPTGRKLAILARVLCRTDNPRQLEHPPALSQTRFLVDAVSDPMLYGHNPARSLAAGTLDSRVEWLASLFERLERRDHSQPDRLS